MKYLDEVFITEAEKLTFLKGLMLLELIDGEVAEEENIMINKRAQWLGIAPDSLNTLLPLNFSMPQEAKSITFNTKEQAVFFLLEAIKLGYRDEIYNEKEKALVYHIALLNEIDPDKVDQLEDQVTKEKLLSNQKDQLIADILK